MRCSWLLKDFRIQLVKYYLSRVILRVADRPFKGLEIVWQMDDGNKRAYVLIKMLRNS